MEFSKLQRRNDARFIQALDRAVSTIARNIAVHGNAIPDISADESTWRYCGPASWVSGFWAGQLWLCYKATADQRFRVAAESQKEYHSELLNHKEYHDHDLGFQFTLSCVAEYKMTGSRLARKMALEAADSLIDRFRGRGNAGFFVAWNPDHSLGAERTRGKAIIDSLQNMSLLFWATQECGDESFRDKAIIHTNTLKEFIVREDFSTFHTYNFDPDTIEPLGGETHQGYADGSCWSRGQAWAIHGFSQIYMHTHEAHFLEVAKNLADYAIARLPNDAVPLWDFSVPKETNPVRDSSAGSITCAGLFLLSDLLEDKEERGRYRVWAQRMLLGLIETCDITIEENPIGLLRNGASYVNAGLNNNILPYGDYYYLEALQRALNDKDFFW